MNQPYRLAQNDLNDFAIIDRSQPLNFRFDGKSYQGYAGDTLASALLANGIKLVGRSFKYHRPRGIYTAGSEEPNALVTLRNEGRREPNTRATVIELYDGLIAESQNRWPSLGFDVGAVNSLFAPFFSAGFYYKTFMWPGAKGWLFYEKFIRKAAGLGKAGLAADPDRHERCEAFCDILIVGAGPAGLSAALAASQTGARVILVDENAYLGGAIAKGCIDNDATAANTWLKETEQELTKLTASAELTILKRTTAFGYYDGNVLGLVERVSDHLAEPSPYTPRQRHWVVRAKKVILATGALERPLLFANNDRPGVMLASAARTYLNRYAINIGQRIVIFCNNDSAYLTAVDLAQWGKAQVTLIDQRAQVAENLKDQLQQHGIQLKFNSVVTAVKGRQKANTAVIRSLSDNRIETLPCDAVLSAGGWSPVIHLHSQAGDKPIFDEKTQSFLPGAAREDWVAVGSCTGERQLSQCLQQGQQAGADAAQACGFDSVNIRSTLPSFSPQQEPTPLSPLTTVDIKGKCFVDLQNDVTTKDIELAQREGYAASELTKRYTTMGMGTDQGKLGNVNGLALLAEQRQTTIPEVGVTTFRPPYTPVAIGTLAGRGIGQHLTPTRYTPMHDWHTQNGAIIVDSAAHWQRPAAYPRTDESRRQAAIREAAHIRQAVGIVDVSTLGKIDIQGPDAAQFLERVYVNRWQKLAVGKARYGVMLREDGLVFDDGTTTRVANDRFFMTTTTANAAAILRHMEYLLQVVWPDWRVAVTNITDQWAAIALAGPRSREVLAKLLNNIDISNTALPFMGLLETTAQGIPVRVMRISFSGELAYELYVPADYGQAIWQRLLTSGEAFGIIPYGLDAMDILRIEKGHVTGAEIDGRRTLDDLGLGTMARLDKDFVGRAMSNRAGLLDPNRPKLVGLLSVDPKQPLSAGAHLVRVQNQEPAESWGFVSSVCYSPSLQREIGLGFVRGGRDRIGTTFYTASPLLNQYIAVEIASPHFVDPQGEHLHG